MHFVCHRFRNPGEIHKVVQSKEVFVKTKANSQILQCLLRFKIVVRGWTKIHTARKLFDWVNCNWLDELNPLKNEPAHQLYKNNMNFKQILGALKELFSKYYLALIEHGLWATRSSFILAQPQPFLAEAE